MRLLEILQNGDVRLTTDLLEDAIPPYAILSHRWGNESQEVTFEDIQAGSGRQKDGYKKIEFCSNQARSNRLKYFWVDSCCINKKVEAEVSRAIQSMFSWYRNASQCYVYLSDVSTESRRQASETCSIWGPAFCRSDWFKRGWTLQELLAPGSVEFFSKEGRRLGDRSSLRQKITRITNIPLPALDGAILSDFTVKERLSWAVHRQTTIKEDKAYSLLGIFGVSLIPIQNEGEGKAFERLRKEIDKLEHCMQAVHRTDPRKDKKRIEEGKYGLLKESCRWILGHPDFQQWSDTQNSPLLWIKGNPGKGKTMLVCGIIDELDKSKGRTYLLSYFYCQETDDRLNTATDVLRGLLYMLITQQPSLSSHVQHQLDRTDGKIFEDVNAWVCVSDIFTSLLQDPALPTTYLVVDALDECRVDRPKLLNFIARLSSLNPRVKWLVSSRDWPSISECLNKAQVMTQLPLELNTKLISKAVNVFIKQRVYQMAQEKKLDSKTRDAIFNYLSSNANETFLWAALVLQSLQETYPWNLLRELRKFPPGLDALYKRMIEQINENKDAGLCKRILATTLLAYRPITLHEVTCLVSFPFDIVENLNWVKEIISHCGSFLTVRNSTIYLVHQSAKEYLLDEALATVFPDGKKEAHYQLFSRSLNALATVLYRDMYKIEEPGYLIEDIKDPNPDPLIAHRYSVIYWVNHLKEWNFDHSPKDPLAPIQDSCVFSLSHLHNAIEAPPPKTSKDLCDVAFKFLKEHFLHWLESLSLLRQPSVGIFSVRELLSILKLYSDSDSEFVSFLKDGEKFALSYRSIIDQAPLQTYGAALVFCPTETKIKEWFWENQRLPFIKSVKGIKDGWDSLLQTLEGHTDSVNAVAFSPDGKLIASGSDDKTVRLWDSATGMVQGEPLKGHTDSVYAVTFSPDGKLIASASRDQTVRLWDSATGMVQGEPLKGHTDSVNAVAFSPDSKLIASASFDKTVRLWDLATGMVQGEPLKGHTDSVNAVTFSPNGKLIVSVSFDMTVRLWDSATGMVQGEPLKDHTSWVNAVAFSPNGKLIASALRNKTVRLWDLATGMVQGEPLKGHTRSVNAVTFSPDGKLIASASFDKTVRLWDSATGMVQGGPLKGHTSWMNAVAFSPDGKLIISASNDKTVRLWDSATGMVQGESLKGHTSSVTAVTFSPDGKLIASASSDTTVRLWDSATGMVQGEPLEAHNDSIYTVAFSPDGKLIALVSYDETVRLWDLATGIQRELLKGHTGWVNAVAFSPDGKLIASASDDRTVMLWDLATGMVQGGPLKGHTNSVNAVAFSPDSKLIASASFDRTVRLWDSATGMVQGEPLRGHTSWVYAVAFSPDGKLIASASDDKTVRLWDSATGMVQGELQTNVAVLKLQFSTDGQVINTDRGQLDIRTIFPRDMSVPLTPGRGLFVDGEWIIQGTKKILWLPPDYRATCVAVYGCFLAMGHVSGRVSMIEVEELSTSPLTTS